MQNIEKALKLIEEGKLYACLMLLPEKDAQNTMLKHLEEKFVMDEVDEKYLDKLRIVAHHILATSTKLTPVGKDWSIYFKMYPKAIFYVALGIFISLISLTTNWATLERSIATSWGGWVSFIEYGLYTNNVYFTFSLLLYCGIVALHDIGIWKTPFYIRILMLSYFVYHLLAWFIPSFWEIIYFKAGYLFNALFVAIMITFTYKEYKALKKVKKMQP